MIRTLIQEGTASPTGPLPVNPAALKVVSVTIAGKAIVASEVVVIANVAGFSCT